MCAFVSCTLSKDHMEQLFHTPFKPETCFILLGSRDQLTAVPRHCQPPLRLTSLLYCNCCQITAMEICKDCTRTCSQSHSRCSSVCYEHFTSLVSLMSLPDFQHCRGGGQDINGKIIFCMQFLSTTRLRTG
jgi:hypothetical protein